jgi:prenyl protein peptidase
MLFSLLSCFCIALLFVLVLNFVSGPDARNLPQIVRVRILAAILVSILITLCLFVAFGVSLEDLGVKREGNTISAIVSLCSVILLYLGPLVQPFFKERGRKVLIRHLWNEYTQDEFVERWDLAVRNLVVAPITEEWVFRSCMLSLLLPVMRPWKAVVVSPMLFGLCHLHHIFEWFRSPVVPFKHVCLQVLFQVCYTFVFGTYAAYLFVLTGRIAGPIAVHVFCNFFGFPPIQEISQSTHPKVVWGVYVTGLLTFLCYLYGMSYIV